jgi:very-short-patch-repair endonuclease
MTPAEQRLWAQLRNRKVAGLKFRRQHPIGPFIVDFYCAAHRLVVEVDGSAHDGQEVRDVARTEWLVARGYAVVRFRNERVVQDMRSVIREILMACGLA